jgi:hypothetical protein
MNNFKKYLITAISFAMLIGAFVFSGPLAGNSFGAAPPGEVKVVNTSTQPVPTVVTNTPSVKINTDADHPVFVRDVDNPAREAFQHDITFTLPDNFSEVCSPLIAVPAGKRLVIEYVSGKATFPAADQKLRNFSIRTTVNGNQVYHYLVPTATGIFNEYVAGQQTRLYADANTLPHICVSRSNLNDGIVTVQASISGYLVDMP